MNSMIELLSGEVPGGFLLLLLILFIVNLSLFFFFRGSKFFTKEVYKKKAIKSSLFLVVTYVALWIILKPVPIPESILILPFQNGKVSDYKISEILEQQLDGKLSEDYRLHNWDWFYETCNKDSIDNFDYRVSVANRLKVNIVITGRYLNESKINVMIKSESLNLNNEFEIESYADLAIKISSWINENLQIINETELNELQVSDDYLSLFTKAKLLYLNSDYISALNMVSNMDSIPVLLMSNIYLELGIKELKNSKKSDFKDNINKYFVKLQNLLIPIAKEGNDNSTLNRILGRLYLYEEKYKEAEIFLKKGLTQNPYNARIYNDFYYLHQDRFKDLGFDDRFEILRKAIELDNGFIDAVYNLANDYFQTGTGIKSGKGTTFALETLNRFMKINSENKKILALLANIKLQIKHAEEAAEIYNKLIELGNNESEIYYNLGICYFHLKKYDEAKKSFLKSISINEFPDSYLYMGAINKILGNYDKALYYYRERIKRSKKGEDDYYAKEALHGLQWILERQYEDSSKSEL